MKDHITDTNLKLLHTIAIDNNILGGEKNLECENKENIRNKHHNHCPATKHPIKQHS